MTDELDAFVPCAEPGCAWHVALPETRCEEHGGEPGPAYFTDSEGTILVSRHLLTALGWESCE